MKNTFYILLLVATTILSACSGRKEASLENTSPNGKAHIRITGKRASVADGWKVDMKVKAYDFKEGLLSFEIYADDLTPETVKFDWVDNNNCNITYEEIDHAERRFHLIASPNQVQMAEVN